MGRRLHWRAGGGRRNPFVWVLVFPVLLVFGMFAMIGLTMGGAGSPSNQEADQQDKASQAAKAVANCAAGSEPAAAAATSTVAGSAVSSAAASEPESAPSDEAEHAPSDAVVGKPDPAVVKAYGVELSGDQLEVAEAIAARAGGSQDRAAAGLMAGWVVSQLDPERPGGLFGGAVEGATVPQMVSAFNARLNQTGALDGSSALSDAVVDAVEGASGTQLARYEGWASELAGYLVTGRSAVTVDEAGKVECVPPAPVVDTSAGGGVFDPGNIVSDKVFYNAKSMTEAQVRAWLAERNAGCSGACVSTLRMDVSAKPETAYCKAYEGGMGQDAAAMIVQVSVACGINPQVMLVTLEKESQGVTKASSSDFAAAWGWHCPDTGPGGSANCDPEHGGFFNQLYGMAEQWKRYKVDPGKYNYRAGQTANILWNVAESGCGSAPVTIKNQATAGLYNYTPYQPNAAALAAYPGEGDACSAYGNRNFFFMFTKWWGSTGGGAPAGGVDVGGKGVSIKLPAGSPVQGTVKAPSERMAAAIRTALSQLGMPYVWAGGDTNGPTTGAGETGEIGFDCSGLMIYAYAQLGVELPHYSGAQRDSGVQRPFAEARPGDLLFWGGTPGGGAVHHVAMYLGQFGGTPYMVEAPQRGTPVRVAPVRTGAGDWAGVAVTPAAAVGGGR